MRERRRSAMDATMKRKIDAVLDRILDPETNLTIAQLGLVQRIRYEETWKKLSVFTGSLGPTHGCCTLLGMAHMSTTLENLKNEFDQEFPDLNTVID
jgi:metal-sulfur cluster biosynthetic enzyme